MDKTRRQKEVSLRCSPGAVLLIVSITCLVAGFLAGRTYGGKKIVADAEAIGRGIVVEASSMVNEAGAMMLKQAADSVANLALITGMQDWVGKTDPMCTNTCKKANNGICDDGRGNLTAANQETPLRVFCDLGTDCNDCGPWVTSLKPTWVTRNEEGPISLLAQKGVEVRVKQVHPTLANQVPFRFAYTDPSKDVDISQSMEHTSMVEPVITKIFFKIFQGGCLKANGSRAVFADVGGNFGWFSVLGAAMGCRVIAFEPVPHFRAFLEYNLHLNNLQHLVEVKPNVVSNVHMKPMKMVVPSSGIWGTAGIDGLNIDKNIPGTTEDILVQSLTLNNVIQEDLLLLKVDVEGWEWSVMKGADEMLKNYNVQNIVMEYSPGVPERNHKYNDVIATVQMLVDLHTSGYKIGHIEEKTASHNMDSPLLPLKAITSLNLKYDMKDAQLFKAGQLGCPLPQELEPTIGRCGAVPEQINPRSLRSDLGHNTNIWATKTDMLMQTNGTVGVLKLGDPADTYFIPKGSDWGMGMRRCSDMDPKWQVRHRCPCTNPVVCGAEEELYKRLASEGKLAHNYIIPDDS